MSQTETPTRAVRPLGAVALVAALFGLAPGGVTGQTNFESIMILAPVPAAREADSLYAQEFAEAVRARMTRRRRLHTIRMCDISDACVIFVEGDAIRNYARLVGADYYISGRHVRSGGMDRFEFDLGETGRLGGFMHHSTTLTAAVDTSLELKDQAEDVADIVYDTLRVVQEAGDRARKCWNDLRDRKYDNARDHAEKAMEAVPRHPSAATCASRIFVESGASIDSVIWALEQATTGDSTIYQAWADLANAYLRRGDTALAMRARAQEARGDKDDTERLVRLASQMNEFGYADSAVTILDEYSGRNPLDEEMNELLIRLCLRETDYDCALETMARRYAADSSLVGDTTFYFRAISVARSASDTSLLHWTTEAVDQVDLALDSARARAERRRLEAERIADAYQEVLVSHAGALAADGRGDSALVVYQTVLEEDSSDLRAVLGLARLLIVPSRLTIDSVVPLDTAALGRVESLLARVVSGTEDPRYHQTAGALYLELATRLVQARLELPRALWWSERARQLGHGDESLTQRGGAMKGLAAFYRMLDVDSALRAEPSCDLLLEERQLIRFGSEDLTAGASHLPGVADNVLSTFAAYAELVPAHHEALQCEWPLLDETLVATAVSDSTDVGPDVSHR